MVRGGRYRCGTDRTLPPPRARPPAPPWAVLQDYWRTTGEGLEAHWRIAAEELEVLFLRSAAMMTLHKLTAGDGYTYLTRQVAAFDATVRGRAGLGDYYA